MSRNPKIRKWLRGADRFWLVLSLLTALFFWIALAFPFTGRFILKTIPVFSLALIVWNHQKSRQEILLFAGLIFHSLGDAVLDIEQGRWLLPAMGAFLLGHIFYILTFNHDRAAFSQLSRSRRASLFGAFLFITAIAAILILHLRQSALLAPVLVYMLVISAMATVSIFANYQTLWVSAGALAYVFSDSLIAINLFVSPLPGSAYLTWPAYYLAQFLIALGFLREKTRR